MEVITGEQIGIVRETFFGKGRDAGFCSEDLERVKVDDVWIRRFLAAAEGNVDTAVQTLFETCQWRKEFGTNELDESKIPSRMFEKGSLFIRNEDMGGHKLLIFKSKYHLKGTEDIEDIKKFIVYFFERIERESRSQPISIIFDMKDSGWNNMDMDFVRYLISLLKTQYPYFVNLLMIFEMPWLLNAAWKIIRTWLPPKFVERVKFVDKKSINEFISPKNQLKAWGGEDDYEYSFECEIRNNNNRKVAFERDPPKRRDQDEIYPSGLLRNIETQKESPPGLYSKEVAKSNEFYSSHPSGEGKPSREGGEGPLTQVDGHIEFSEEEDEISGNFRIRNTTGRRVLFKIKTTAPDKYRVRPTIGFLEPNASCTIGITIYQGSSLKSVPHDRFQVQVNAISDKIHIEQAAAHDFGELNRMWKQLNTGNLENHRITCSIKNFVKALGSSGSSGAVTLNEDDIKKNLKKVETNIVESMRVELTGQMNQLKKLLYALILLVSFFFLTFIFYGKSNAC